MKVSRLSDQRIAVLLKQVDGGVGIKKVGRKVEISRQTCFQARKKYGGLTPSEVRRLSLLTGDGCECGLFLRVAR